jgi:hypothetical protein
MFVQGVCAATGWEPSGIGPNCTFVGEHKWRGDLLVGSCARNVRSALDKFQQAWIASLLDRTSSSSVLIFEDEQRSGDPDGTRQSLRTWAQTDKRVRLLLAQPLLYPRWSRTQWLALCRNMLVSEAAAALSTTATRRRSTR